MYLATTSMQNWYRGPSYSMNSALLKATQAASCVERQWALIGEDVPMDGQGRNLRAPSEGEALQGMDTLDQPLRLHEDLRSCLQGNHSGSSGMGTWSNHQRAFPPMHGKIHQGAYRKPWRQRGPSAQERLRSEPGPVDNTQALHHVHATTILSSKPIASPPSLS
jgi:hypothetical protein